ncbi:A24 family peptidase [Brucepastera parasyntrophica]|uniref:prepilin peptidase n=1 Tax=Brucepastera parasyntrophica TaxID=2880008 RepID=UPI00210C32CB|nr:A24 family peptidase [Brucepastera parasyntrophica]ULQ59092.1 A24 family peptidase [Brucepastera parasyntrophica]
MLTAVFTPAFCVFLAFAVPISVIDIRSYRIPDILSLPCFILLLIVYCVTAPSDLPLALLSSSVSAILFLLIRVTTKGLGFGDVKYAAVVGLFCGFPYILAAFLAAALTGLIAAVVLIVFLKKDRSVRIPFAPFLAAGAVAAHLVSVLAPFY